MTKRTDDSTGQLRWHYPVPEAGYGFCATCGSSLFWKSTATPHRISICAGTLVQRYSKFGIE